MSKPQYLLFGILFIICSSLSANDFYKAQIMKPTPFMGNNGEVFKLNDGSLWEVQYSYEYMYAYYPEILISYSRGEMIVNGKKINVKSLSSNTRPAVKPQNEKPIINQNGKNGYFTKIDNDDGDILKLRNGGVVEIISFIGIIGFNKDAILYRENNNWKLWIEGKKSYRCDLLKAPGLKPNLSLEKRYITKKSNDGSILTDINGRIFEVSSFSMLDTSLWLAPFDALLINGNRMINLDDNSDIIDIQPLN